MGHLRVFAVIVVSGLSLSCGRALKKSPVGLRNNFSQIQASALPAGAVTAVSLKNPAMIGGYSITQAVCQGVSGPDAGSTNPITLLTGYNEVFVVSNTDLAIDGGLGTCTYQIQMSLVGLTDQSFFVKVSAFHAYDSGADITANLGASGACTGVIPNVSGASGLLQIDYTFDKVKNAFSLSYPVTAGSYCGDGNREVDSYAGST